MTSSSVTSGDQVTIIGTFSIHMVYCCPDTRNKFTYMSGSVIFLGIRLTLMGSVEWLIWKFGLFSNQIYTRKPVQTTARIAWSLQTCGLRFMTARIDMILTDSHGVVRQVPIYSTETWELQWVEALPAIKYLLYCQWVQVPVHDYFRWHMIMKPESCHAANFVVTAKLTSYLSGSSEV